MKPPNTRFVTQAEDRDGRSLSQDCISEAERVLLSQSSVPSIAKQKGRREGGQLSFL